MFTAYRRIMTIGYDNVAIGITITTGNDNIAIGYTAENINISDFLATLPSFLFNLALLPLTSGVANIEFSCITSRIHSRSKKKLDFYHNYS